MSRYNANANQYGTHYDPVGSNTNQPTAYTYQSGPTAAGASGHASSTNPANYSTTNYSNPFANNGNHSTQANYGHQQYGTVSQNARNSTNRAAAALSSLSSSEYNQSSSAQQTSSVALDNSSWGHASYNTGPYTNNESQVPDRSYAPQPSANTHGASSVAEHQHHKSNMSSSYPSHGQGQQNGRTSAVQPYTNVYTQQPVQTQQQQPQRYSSPINAMQAQQQQQQQQHAQSSRAPTYQPSSPVATQNLSQTIRQHRASVEPSPTTVNPSQVYDDRAERQRKAQVEAEKRRKREVEAARKIEEDKKKAEEERRKSEAEAANKAEQESKAEEERQAREEKQRSKTAATALTKMASSGAGVRSVPLGDEESSLPPPANAEEAEMRAMFKKMREFNARNPAMLAKLWEEERKTHANTQSSTAAQSTSSKPLPARPDSTAATLAMTASASALASASASAAPPAPTLSAEQRQQKAITAGPSKTQQIREQPGNVNEPQSAAKPTAQRAPAPRKPATLWPPQKRSTLAEAAIKWLLSLPENAGKAVRREDILKLLETNPSYVKLCESLEGLGFRFERTSLARELLRASPDMQKAPSSGPVPNVNFTSSHISEFISQNQCEKPPARRTASESDRRPVSGNKTVHYEVPGFPSLAEAARGVKSVGRCTGMDGGPVQPPQDYYPPSAAVSRAPSQSQPRPPVQLPVQAPAAIKPEVPRRPPANKEEAARKRTFGDLVDLTAEDSDDDGPPPKMLQPLSGPVNGVVTQPQPQPSGLAAFRQSPSFNGADLEYRASVGSAVPQGLQRPVSTGPSPQQAPPNTLHAPTQGPPKPPAPKSKSKGPGAEFLQQERIRGRMLVEPIMRDRVARKSQYDTRTIARDVLLATGRHPDMRALNAHLNTMQKLLGDHGGSYETDGTKGNRSDLSTIQWDIIDPEPEKPKAQAEPSGSIAQDISSVQIRSTAQRPGLAMPSHRTKIAALVEEVDDADDEDDNHIAGAPVRATRQETVDHGDGTVSHVSVNEPVNQKSATAPKKRRGRPPKYDIHSSTTLAGSHTGRQTPALNQRNPSTRAAGTPARQPSAGRGNPLASTQAAGTTPIPAGRPIGYGAFQNVDEHGNKKKGRPFGWRKSVHSREAHGLTPAKNPSKPGSSASRARDAPIQEPRYQVYKCQWEGCGAELHNLDTLKKHVVKVHGHAGDDGKFECHWVPCGGESQQHTARNGKARITDVAEFSATEGWMGHVDKQHLQPVAWKLGDGPKGGLSDYNTDSEAPYLSDAQGRSVTPIIRPNDQTTTNANLSSTAPRVGRPPKDGMTKDERRATAELQQLTAHKRAVGPLMEKTGSTLASPKRRMGFLDDEDFEDEIRSEGEGGG